MTDIVIQQSDYRLGLSAGKVVIKNGRRELVKEIAISLVESILIFGHAQLSTQLLGALARQEINVYYFSGEGTFLYALDSYRKEDFEKQELQARASFDPDFCLSLSRSIATAKVKHQLSLLQNYNQEDILAGEDFERFHESLEKMATASSIAELMGYEGRIAKSYFYYLGLLLPASFHFYGRSRRPAKDAVNSLLNFGYSLLYSTFIGLIRKNGLSSGFAVLHQSHQHHASLASDLMEEWRPVIVDNTVVDLILNQEIRLEHFRKDEGGAVWLTDEGRKVFIAALRERMLEIHPYIELDKKRYSFLYQADQQIKRLLRACEKGEPGLYLTSYTGE